MCRGEKPEGIEAIRTADGVQYVINLKGGIAIDMGDNYEKAQHMFDLLMRCFDKWVL